MERGCNCSNGKCSKLLKVKKVGEGRYNIAGRNVFIRVTIHILRLNFLFTFVQETETVPESFRHIFIIFQLQLLKGRHMMVRVGGGWDTLEHFLSRHEPCQVRLVTTGRRGDVLPVTLPPPDTELEKLSPISRKHSLTSLASSKTSLTGKEPSLPGTVSPVDSKASSISGKLSPTEKPDRPRPSSKASSGKSSPSDGRRTSTPIKQSSARNLRSALTLPLKTDSVDGRQQKSAPPSRKQSAPSFSTPNTPTSTRPSSVRTTSDFRKSLTSANLSNAPKKSRSMSLALQNDDKKHFCGTDRLNQAKSRANSVAATPNHAQSTATITHKARSQSLASTPVGEAKKAFIPNGTLNGYAKKTRSMSLANAVDFRPMSKSISVSVAGAMTQAAIEESIRLSLAATIADDSAKKPFLHIKAKYRSPPPREVPPR